MLKTKIEKVNGFHVHLLSAVLGLAALLLNIVKYNTYVQYFYHQLFLQYRLLCLTRTDTYIFLHFLIN